MASYEPLVPLKEIAGVLGLAGLDEPPGWSIHEDWAGRFCLTERDAARFVRDWRHATAEAQREAQAVQDRASAKLREEELYRQRTEALESALIHREARKRAAIRQAMIAARRAAHGGLMPDNFEEQAAARAGIEAAERFESENRLPELP